MGVARFERFFRDAAGVDVDKHDLKRYSDFVHSKVYDLLVMGVATAKANGRDIIEPFDLPITKGLQLTLTWGFAVMGSNDQRGSHRAPAAGAPEIRIRAWSIMGGVDVWRVPTGVPGSSADARRAAKELERGGRTES